MFESDDWTFEVALNDLEEKAIPSYSYQCQSKGEISSCKRRKVEDVAASSSAGENTFDSKLDAVVNTKDYCARNNASRKNLLLEIFQENADRRISNFTDGISKSMLPKDIRLSDANLSCNEMKDKNHTMLGSKARFGKETKLIEIFPGPAGLVSNMRNKDTPDLSDTGKLENKTTADCIEINFPKPQDEKDPFNGKAWRFLLDDLPNNILIQYGISNIENRANAGHCDSTKVKCIAGILDYVDHSFDDPLITLKDSTGSIEGTIHRDIMLNYPDILEPNVAILLYDIGLLKTTTCILTNRYHILISRANLLAIYSSKGRIVCASDMESILSRISNVGLTGDYCTVSLYSKHCAVSDSFNKPDNLDDNCTVLHANCLVGTTTANKEPTLLDNSLLRQLDEKRKSYNQVYAKNNENYKLVAKTFESPKHPPSMNCSTNDFPFIENRSITSDEQAYVKCTSPETSMQINTIERCKSQTQNTNDLDGMREVVSSASNMEKKNVLQSLQGRDSSIVKMSSLEPRDQTPTIQSTCSRKDFLPYDDVAHKRHSNLRTTSASPILKSKAESSKNLARYFTKEKCIFHDEYDSDDEMLSQLDIDNTFQ